MLYTRPVLQKILKSDVNTAVQRWQSEVSRVQSELRRREKELNVQMVNAIDDMMLSYRKKHSFLLRKDRMTQYIAKIQCHERRYEHCECRPVQFLRFIKEEHLPPIQETPHLHNTFFYHCLRKTTVYVGGINVECQVTEAATVTTLTTYKPGIATVLLINSTDGASVKFNQRSGLVREREREGKRKR